MRELHAVCIFPPLFRRVDETLFTTAQYRAAETSDDELLSFIAK